MDFHCFVFNSKAKCVKLVFSDQNYSKLRLYIYIYLFIYTYTITKYFIYNTETPNNIYLYVCGLM